MNVLVGYGVVCAAMTKFIFQRAASVLYHMNDVFF